MFKQYILIIYKNGSSISLDVPENYYQNKYKNKPEKKLHKIFMNEYKSFVKALNKNEAVVPVGKYLSFSQASISGKDIISVDLKSTQEVEIKESVTTFVPGVHDQVYLNITGTDLEKLLSKLEETNLIENISKLIDKIYSYLNKSNVEFSIKTAKRPSAPKKKKAAETNPVVFETDQSSNQ